MTVIAPEPSAPVVARAARNAIGKPLTLKMPMPAARQAGSSDTDEREQF